MGDDQFCHGGPQPAESGTLPDIWKSALHPLQESVAAPKVGNDAKRKPTHEDDDCDNQDVLRIHIAPQELFEIIGISII
jgi:hypothetical protein